MNFMWRGGAGGVLAVFFRNTTIFPQMHLISVEHFNQFFYFHTESNEFGFYKSATRMSEF